MPGSAPQGFTLIVQDYYTPHGKWYSLEGSLDEVRIYNRALSDEEVAQLACPVIEATVDIKPDTIDVSSKDKWVTCYINAPDDYHASYIDVESILLEDLLEVQQSDIQNGVLMFMPYAKS